MESQTEKKLEDELDARIPLGLCRNYLVISVNSLSYQARIVGFLLQYGSLYKLPPF